MADFGIIDPTIIALINASNTFTQIQKIAVDNGIQMTFYRPINTGGFGAGFYYNFNNSSSAEVTYGNQYVSIEDNTAGSHRGDFNVQLSIAASLGIRFRVYTAGNGGLLFGNNQRIQIDEGGLTAARIFTLPDANDQLVGNTTAATITNKTISGSSNTISNVPDGALSANIPLKNGSNSFTALQTFRDNLIRFWNPALNFPYMIRTSALTATRDITLPLLAANDTFVFEAHTQTLTNKTISDLKETWVGKSTTYTMTDADYGIICTGTSTYTITLPAVSGRTGRVFQFKKTGASGTITIDGNASETIDGATTQTISTQWQKMKILCTGTEWLIIAN